MRLPSNRGAARVSAVWIIVLVVLFLAGLAFAFIAQSDMTAQRERADQAIRAAAAADAKREAQFGVTRAISLALGFYDEDSAETTADPELALAALEDFKRAFPDLGSSVTNFGQAVQPIINAHAQRGLKLAELEGRIASLEGELAQARVATTEIGREKDTLIADLRSQISDLEENAARRQSELEDRLATANEANTNLDLTVRETRAQMTDRERELQRELQARETKIESLAKLTTFAKEPHASKPDGEIIATSSELPLGWINIGSNNRLTTGTRFEVRAGDLEGGYKGMCEVVRIEPNRAEVMFYDVVDRFDPVAKGDRIINKLYDPTGGRNAVLVGRFSGAYTQNELTIFLERMGINVQPRLDATTHFLIVGSELYTDPDTNEPLEEPIQPSELAVYKNAEAQGVEIVPLQDVRQFFAASASE
ncbi:MAG: hypothetical protein WD226_08830 [Planctomycetota bacterium]